MKKIISLGFVLATPFVAFAVTTNAFDILTTIRDILGWVMPILIALAAVWFVWGVIQYVISQDEEKKKKARGAIIQGLIGLFIIVAFWGIIGIVMRTFDVDRTTGTGIVPCLPGQLGC